MDSLDIVAFFNLCVIDISKLKGINLREFLELRDPPEYYLIVNPAKVEIDKLDNYRVKTIADGQFYIASQAGSEDYYIPEAGYALVNVTSKVSGIILNIFYTRLLYIDLNGYTNEELLDVYSVIQNVYVAQYQIDIICIQSPHQIKESSINNYKYYRPRPDYDLNILENYHILIKNLNNSKKFSGLSAESNIYQSGNYGTTIYIPNWLLEYLERCLEIKSHRTPNPP
jgi:hypothetical protein